MVVAHTCALATSKVRAGLPEPGVPGRLGPIRRNGEREQKRARKEGKKEGREADKKGERKGSRKQCGMLG